MGNVVRGCFLGGTHLVPAHVCSVDAGNPSCRRSVRALTPIEQSQETRMRLPSELCCFEHCQPFATDNDADRISEKTQALMCPSGCRIPVMRGIPRFVNSKNYASAFGRQWQTFRQTQLDSYTGTTISRDRLTRCLGGSLDIVRGKSVLEVG